MDDGSGARRGEVPSRRLVGLDVARALAIGGMIAVNFMVVLAAPSEGGVLGQVMSLPMGRASALFVVLAGVGLVLLAGDDTRSGRRRVLRRALFLLAVGYPFWVVWEGDILHYYGWYFLLGGLALGLRARVLFALAALCSVASLVLLVALDYGKGWNFASLEYRDRWTLGGQLRNLVFNGFHPLLPWQAFVFYGMGLGRILRASRERFVLLAWPALGVAAVTEVISHYSVQALGGTGENELAYLLVTDSMPPAPLYVIASASLATFVIALSVQLARRWPKALLVRSLAHAGQLALTVYVLHVVLGVFPVVELIGPGACSAQAVFWLWTGFWLTSIVFSHLWRRRFRRGPAETLMRSLTG